MNIIKKWRGRIKFFLVGLAIGVIIILVVVFCNVCSSRRGDNNKTDEIIEINKDVLEDIAREEVRIEKDIINNDAVLDKLESGVWKPDREKN